MCGIAGTLVRDGLSPDDLTELELLGDLMARRGPDDRGRWDDGAHCALTFRRLAIIDLGPGGHQPMVTPDGKHALVFNGELYNFRELRTQLTAEGITFRSSSDSEVVLWALVHWGRSALTRFNGMFALAWYRTSARTLLLARDPIGIKPLFWWRSPAAFLFGSQYDQVIRHRRCRRDQIEPEVLHLYLRLGHLPAPYGLVADTGQVRPGCSIEVRPGSPIQEHRFADPWVVPHRSRRLSGIEAEHAVEEAVTAAVERQAVSDVRLGCFLSGGIDSPLVAANLQSVSESTVPAFTIGTNDSETDESEAATAFGCALGLDHHLRRISADLALDMIDEFAQAYPDPFADYSAFPTLMVSELAREHVAVVQSGDGGDELFWGYPRFRKVRAARRWFRLPRELRVAGYGATKALRRHQPPRGVVFETIGDWYLDAHSGLRELDFGLILPAGAPLPGSFDAFHFDRPEDDDALVQWMRANELAIHLPMVLAKVDRASMYHSLEVRVPLLDLEVAALAHRLDPGVCLTEGEGKTVLRRALARRLPDMPIPSAKKGFTIPLGAWLRSELKPIVHDLLIERDPFPHGAFDRSGVAALVEAHESGTRDVTRGLWNLLALQLWAQAHLKPLELQ